MQGANLPTAVMQPLLSKARCTSVHTHSCAAVWGSVSCPRALWGADCRGRGGRTSISGQHALPPEPQQPLWHCLLKWIFAAPAKLGVLFSGEDGRWNESKIKKQKKNGRAEPQLDGWMDGWMFLWDSITDVSSTVYMWGLPFTAPNNTTKTH